MAGGSLAFMPVTIGSLPFDLAFFYTGILAKRNQWLDESTSDVLSSTVNTMNGINYESDKNDDRDEEQVAMAEVEGVGFYGANKQSSKGSMVRYLESYRLLNYSIAISMCCGLIVCVSIIYIQDLHTILFTNTDSGDDEGIDDDSQRDTDTTVLPSILTFLITSGLMTVFISLSALDMSRKYLNFQSSWTKYLSGAAYGVYIFHPFFIQLYVLIYVELIIPTKIYWQENAQSTTHLGSDAWLWGGFIGCIMLIVPSCFIFSGWIRQFFPNIL